jgi:hypothetical protein
MIASHCIQRSCGESWHSAEAFENSEQNCKPCNSCKTGPYRDGSYNLAGNDSSPCRETNLAPAARRHYPPRRRGGPRVLGVKDSANTNTHGHQRLPPPFSPRSMRALFATACLALALTGCRGSVGGPLGQLTIPPPGTQPPGALLADNSYYPGSSTPAAASSFGSSAPAALADSNLTNADTFPRATPPGAAISRSSLAASSPAKSPPSREDPIRIPSDSSTATALAAIVPIRPIPTTDVTGLFETVRAQLATRTSLAAGSPASRGFVEISQLPDAPPELRRAALSGHSLR